MVPGGRGALGGCDRRLPLSPLSNGITTDKQSKEVLATGFEYRDQGLWLLERTGASDYRDALERPCVIRAENRDQAHALCGVHAQVHRRRARAIVQHPAG